MKKTISFDNSIEFIILHVKEIIVALFLLMLILLGVRRNDTKVTFERLSDYLKYRGLQINIAATEGASADSILGDSVSTIEEDYVNHIMGRRTLLNLNGKMQKLLHMKGYYSNQDIYVSDSGYILSADPFTTTDYETKQVTELNDFLRENGINFIYVNEPTKYADDQVFCDEFGAATYSNRNTDLFLERIRANGVNAIDLREYAARDNIRIEDLFYRTDHHWTVPAGLWASRYMAEGLNEYCGYQIDTSIYDEANYIANKWDKCWLGEQGRKVSASYVGLDNYTELKPAFDTDYTFIDWDETTYDGSFDEFVDEEVYNPYNDIYENTSWHYSYSQLRCINHNVPYGKILIMGDSFDQVTVPFMSLGVHEVNAIVRRNYGDDISFRNYILNGGYDTVIMCYTQCMIGAHDDPNSANYLMFSFDK